MGFSSQAGHVILRSQATPGTFQSDLTTAGLSVPLRGGSLGSSREMLVTDPEIGGGRDVIDAYLGASAFSGDYEFYGRVDALSVFMRAALGTAVTATTTGVTTNTITPSNLAQLPFLSIEELIGNGLECYRYTDAVVNTLHLESDANGYLMGTAGMIARLQQAGVTPVASPTLDTTPLFVGTNITVQYNSVAMPAKSFSFDLNNNFEDDDYRLGSFFLGDLTPKRREISASFGIREKDSALWRQAVYGNSSATAVGGLITKAPLVITISSYEIIPSSTPSTPFSITLTIPSFALSPYTLSVSGDDVIESDIEGRGLLTTNTNIMTAVLKTGRTAIA